MEDNNEKVAAIPYFIHEGEVSRMEREHKDAMEKMEKAGRRLLIALIASLVVLLLNNCAWLTYVNTHYQVETVDEIEK